ncbi:GH36-type glycosyl hydrolase domain-containing protein [Oceanirhabdus sp. W0125-5]|uniref:GH36-type glycosyl hydrolase domain-containing protein n=1 Tax=Oceanirhabdus sp. W0125-5 TaxID=2999116 RepID=UPI0022F2B22E|nr:glucoamylase family protein [Oceanirhabdus sp. W0125-5]WBW98758.1 glucoamylase family protein [Oceanirhabdus sp. W0125-5]
MLWLIFTLTGICILFLFSFVHMINNKDKLDILYNEIDRFKECYKSFKEDNISYKYKNLKKKDKKRIIDQVKMSYEYIQKSYNRLISYKLENINNCERWLVDNISIIEKEYKILTRALSDNEIYSLPTYIKINNKTLKKYPRILLLTMKYIKENEEVLCKENIIMAFKEFEKEGRLSYRELNFLKSCISFSLIQCISVLAGQIALLTEEEEIACELIEKLKENLIDETGFIEIFNDYYKRNKFFFINKTLDYLHEYSENNIPMYNIYNNLVKTNNIDEEEISNKSKKFLIKKEREISRHVKSLNLIEKIQWENCITEISYVEKILLNDPLKVYNEMDLESKKLYRSKIENMSRKFRINEFDIVDFILSKCESEKEKIKKHVGYYLVDYGQKALLKKYGGIFRYSFINKKNLVKIYVFANIILTVFFITTLLRGVYLIDNEKDLIKYIIPGILLIAPFSQLSVTLINWVVSIRKNPEIIPKIDFSNGIPKESKTCVVIPCMFNNNEDIKALVDKLEIYFLGNKDDNIYFTLLGDYVDNNVYKKDEDEKLKNYSLKCIASLNEKYKEHSKFNIFIRKRVFNHRDKYWMGWERKRGKLVEFNKLLRGDKNTTFEVLGGDLQKLQECKHIITLDEDTFLPIGACKKLIGAMEHILNKPVYNNKTHKVIRGYTIIQPRISINYVSYTKSLFSRIFSGDSGFDIYTRAVSDIYQDLFKEGIFTGKGIYNIDMFNNVLNDEIPEYTVLSHDLIEGSFVKCGLATDIEFIDSYPSSYYSFCKRLHRWVRGDWQLLNFLKRKNLKLLNKIQIIDNMRRSLISPSISAIIIFSLLNILPNDKGVWLAAALVSYVMPVLINISEVVFLKAKTYGLLYDYKNYKNTIERILVIIAFIPYNSYLIIDAIVRTLYRMFLSKKNLLQWTPASTIEKNSNNSLLFYVKEMKFAPIFAVIVMLISYAYNVDLMMYYFFPCGLWFLSPYIAYSISRECDDDNNQENVIKNDREYLRRIARKTWGYFEDCVKEETNFLGIDNIQVDPKVPLAERTSPTNIGMAITSNICAYDFGYISMIDAVERIENTIDSVIKLEKLNGHLFNWYDVRTLKPLEPKFISTVDSGNLISYLYLAKRFLESTSNSFLLNKNRINGLRDTLELLSLEYGDRLGDKELLFNAYENIKSIGNQMNYYNYKRITRYLTGLLQELKVLDSKGFWLSKTEDLLKSFEKENRYFNYDLLNELNAGNITYGEFFKMKDDTKFKSIKKNIIDLNTKINKLIEKIDILIDDTEFQTLYNKELGLFSIGYDVNNNKLSENSYDLIASEARITSFMAIVKGDVPVEHWFKLGRNLFMVKNKRVFASWSGTTFEYFMPSLLLKDFKGSAFEEMSNGVLCAQKNFGEEYSVPFGVSESGYFGFDVNDNYQYKAFGVPALAMKNILNPDLVISPYSTFLLMMMNKKDCLENLKKLRDLGMEGKYGLYEAIDFTKRRMKRDKEYEIIKSFMIHHQGMTLMALNNIINNNRLKELFHSIPNVKCMERMLMENIPNSIIFDSKKVNKIYHFKEEKKRYIRKFKNVNLLIPEIHIMSNEKYSSLLSYNGKGVSKRNNICLNYYNKDYVSEEGGILLFINIDKERFWCLSDVNKYDNGYGEVVFKHNDASFISSGKEVYVNYRCTLEKNDALEYRIVELMNNGKETRNIELYSYCEVILSELQAHSAHPAFGKLFMSTEYLEKEEILVCKKRKRSKADKPILGFTYIVGEGEKYFQSNKRKIVGRGLKVEYNPEIIQSGEYDNSSGDVLDPIFSHKIKLSLNPGERKKIYFCYGIADSIDEIKEIYYKNNDEIKIHENIKGFEEKCFNNLEIMDISSASYQLIMNICSKLIFGKRNTCDLKEGDYLGTQQDLWKYGISGDYPIIQFEINKCTGLSHIKQLLKVYQYLKMLDFKFDILILCREQQGYNQPIKDAVYSEIERANVGDVINNNGGIYIKNYYELDKKDIDVFKYVSVLQFNDIEGPLFIQIPFEKKDTLEEEKNQVFIDNSNHEKLGEKHEGLKFFNGYGGFNVGDKSYDIILKGKLNTPSPWCNVISNDDMGFIASERGTMYTWFKNSREFKITPWNNNEITDLGEEYLYIRDNNEGKIFSITKAPFNDEGERKIKHGLGYSKFEYVYNGTYFKMIVFMNSEKNIKHIHVKIKNSESCKKDFTLMYFAGLVLGVNEGGNRRYIRTNINREYEYIYADNPYNFSFKNSKVFLKILDGVNVKFTGDRYEVIKGGSISYPKGIMMNNIYEVVGINNSSCLYSESSVSLKENEEKDIHIILGAGETIAEIEELIKTCNEHDSASYEYLRTQRYWKGMVNKLQVETPDPSFDIMMNSWLIYQIYSCRYKARSAFYQSGGAYGFRDQLQDLIPIIIFNKEEVRKYILEASKRMFKEGDVLHWWHQYIGSGIRTRFSDDLLWLPYVVIEYISKSGDYSILDEETTYLDGEALKENECEKYGIYEEGKEKGTLFDKCIKIIRRGCRFGDNNLPLMGCGDWNDGMNNIGNKGRGESVWLGEFLYDIILKFIELCKFKGANDLVNELMKNSFDIERAINTSAWDGEWYRRAYFDDGTPLGSWQNEDCIIDMISQAWSVISNVGEKEKTQKAMESAEKYLVDYENGLIKLLDPPFRNCKEEPGYIKGYISGIRENGGQYTHGVIWGIIAYIMLNQEEKGYRLMSMINPINKTKHLRDCETYKKEPYVTCADVYSNESNIGLGGWSWYTGSASWYYRLGIEYLLGFKIIEGQKIMINPKVPDSWEEFKIKYKNEEAIYNITLKKGERYKIIINGERFNEDYIPLYEKGNYEVIITF